VESGDFATFLRQRLALRISLPLYGANTLPFDKEIQRDLAPAEGLVYFDYFAGGGEDFARKYRERFGSEPGFASAKAYDAVFMIANAMERCGVERHQIRACLHSIDYRGASGRIQFSKAGILEDSTPNTTLFEVRNGKVVALGK
jgi:branched-chain amino acid transport system substrate-binding protein